MKKFFLVFGLILFTSTTIFAANPSFFTDRFNEVNSETLATGEGFVPGQHRVTSETINNIFKALKNLKSRVASVPGAVWNSVTGGISYMGGNVGIGTTSPSSLLDINGTYKLKKYNTQPQACSASNQGEIALTASFTTCVCDGSSWVKTSDGKSTCSWENTCTGGSFTFGSNIWCGNYFYSSSTKTISNNETVGTQKSYQCSFHNHCHGTAPPSSYPTVTIECQSDGRWHKISGGTCRASGHTGFIDGW